MSSLKLKTSPKSTTTLSGSKTYPENVTALVAKLG